MQIRKLIMTKNPCYISGRKIKPSGIVVHSTGANNSYIKRYVGPDDGILGVNKYGNHWNKASATKCVHAFIGKVDDGSVAVYQTLPWDYRCWGVGSGKKGSYNSSHIQFEVCEDGLTNAEYYNGAFEPAAQLCAYLCHQYGIKTKDIVGHYEAHAAGYGSNHGDPRHWMKKHNDKMDAFRERVAALIGEVDATITDGEDERPSYDEERRSTIRKGAKGAAVTELQGLLKKHGYSLPRYGADGSFGTETETALKAFQKDKGLTADGVCGTATWEALLAAVDKTTYSVVIAGLTKAKADEIVAKYGGKKEAETIAV